jgi:hypothetical protein
VPLVGPTGLRLLIADVPAPFVLEVDQGTIQPITGLPTDSLLHKGAAERGRDALVAAWDQRGSASPHA